MILEKYKKRAAGNPAAFLVILLFTIDEIQIIIELLHQFKEISHSVRTFDLVLECEGKQVMDGIQVFQFSGSTLIGILIVFAFMLVFLSLHKLDDIMLEVGELNQNRQDGSFPDKALLIVGADCKELLCFEIDVAGNRGLSCICGNTRETLELAANPLTICRGIELRTETVFFSYQVVNSDTLGAGKKISFENHVGKSIELFCNFRTGLVVVGNAIYIHIVKCIPFLAAFGHSVRGSFQQLFEICVVTTETTTFDFEISLAEFLEKVFCPEKSEFFSSSGIYVIRGGFSVVQHVGSS